MDLALVRAEVSVNAFTLVIQRALAPLQRLLLPLQIRLAGAIANWAIGAFADELDRIAAARRTSFSHDTDAQLDAGIQAGKSVIAALDRFASVATPDPLDLVVVDERRMERCRASARRTRDVVAAEVTERILERSNREAALGLDAASNAEKRMVDELVSLERSRCHSADTEAFMAGIRELADHPTVTAAYDFDRDNHATIVALTEELDREADSISPRT